ncbi:MAG: hypothetical protein ACRBBP_06100 [Bdellovibrionales bacterium]
MLNQKLRSKISKTALLILSCSLFMGNEGCDSEEAKRRGRILRKSVTSMGIRSAKVEMGNDIDIDIQEIINGQYLTELQNSEYFVSVDRLGIQSLSSQERTQSRKSGMNFKALSVNKTVGTCTNDLPEAILTGNVTGFELGNEFGLGIGFGPGGALGGIISGAEFNLKKMKMSLDMHSFQPLSGTALISANKTGTKTDFGGGLGLNLGIITLNPKAIFREPVVDVIRRTLRSVLVNVGEGLEELEPWSARVYKDNDSHIMINAGSRHGLKKGDTLYISNMKYFWDGEPCISRLDKQLNLQGETNAVAKVIIETAPSADISVARVFESNGVDIQEGARAYIYYLKGTKDSEDPMPEMPNPEQWVPRK